MDSEPTNPVENIADSDSSDGWDYVYSATETEDIYVTLDFTTFSEPPKKPAPKKRRGATAGGNNRGTETKGRGGHQGRNDKQASRAVDTNEVDDLNERDVDPASAEAIIDPTLVEDDTVRGNAEQAAEDTKKDGPQLLRILNLHTSNPIIEQGMQLYSCHWADAIGTDLLYVRSPNPDVDATEPVVGPPVEGGDSPITDQRSNVRRSRRKIRYSKSVYSGAGEPREEQNQLPYNVQWLSATSLRLVARPTSLIEPSAIDTDAPGADPEGRELENEIILPDPDKGDEPELTLADFYAADDHVESEGERNEREKFWSMMEQLEAEREAPDGHSQDDGDIVMRNTESPTPGPSSASVIAQPSTRLTGPSNATPESWTAVPSTDGNTTSSRQ